MKKLLFSVLTIAALGLAACGSDHKQGQPTGKEYTSTYICPMHCEGSGSDQAGTCPACGMDYVLQSEHMKDGHNH